MTLEPGYFDEMYALSDNPLQINQSLVRGTEVCDQRRRVPDQHYDNAFEPGCSIRGLSEMLAPRCGHLLSCDFAAAAVRSPCPDRSARERAGRAAHAATALASRDLRPDRVSEFLYYFAGSELGRMLDLATAALRPGGSLLAVHWRHPVTEYPRGGDEVHRALATRASIAQLVARGNLTSSPRFTSAPMPRPSRSRKPAAWCDRSSRGGHTGARRRGPAARMPGRWVRPPARWDRCRSALW